MPKISVIIPTYNRADPVVKAVESVLNQTFTDLELIVVDDGSTDNTEEVIGLITDPRLRYLKQANRGVSAARNTGIQAATGEFIAFLDSDDLFLPEKIACQMDVVNADPRVGLVYGLFYVTKNGGGRKLQGRCYPPGLDQLPLGPKIHLSTILVQRSWLDQIEGFDENLSVSEDQEFVWRLYVAGCRMIGVPKPLTIRTQQEFSLSRDFHHYTADMMIFVDKIFSDPRMPRDLLSLKNSVYAKHLVIIAASAYLAAEPKVGRDMLERAITMDPALAKQNIDLLVSQFVNFVTGHGRNDREDTLRLVMQHLPGGKLFAREFERRSWHKFHLDRAFEFYQSGELLMCRKYALRALINNLPAALRNRGLLSILVRTWIG